MLANLNLEGMWNFQLDEGKSGLQLPFSDTIQLPGTTSYAKKGTRNETVHLGHLTDEYAYEGYAWFSREIDIPKELLGKCCNLFLERTRVTAVWIDGQEVGTQNSLSAPHVYDITPYVGSGRHLITIRVDNTDYPTKGGHLTSPDTQTNWNGITGRIELQFYNETHLRNVKLYPNAADRSVTIRTEAAGSLDGMTLTVAAESLNVKHRHIVPQKQYSVSSEELSIDYPLGEEAFLWDEESPALYRISLSLCDREGNVLDVHLATFGLRDFLSAGDKFTINGRVTFLRGKHDGLLFPLTGFAPTTVEEWLSILGIAQSYGINHYRFHTCCPPEAAFTAADMLGMYMEPELPFWGTVTDESDERHNEQEQQYLIREGYAMLDAYGNHPSFVMMSLGNELWGSKAKLKDILREYKSYDNRRLYTQGSNNFQFVPVILEEDDFFCGVRFARERLFRGSYAMCDAPLGHIQTDTPDTMKDYDEAIHPSSAREELDGEEPRKGGEIQIQYRTEARTVLADNASLELVSQIPIVSHEIGQFAFYPNFKETAKYTGSLKARNFEVFQQRLEEKGMAHLAESFFHSSGQLAVACYKEELEAAFRTKRLAGFQLLDLQDFSGQGTALVGILDAFMDSKGFISSEEWQAYCSDAVLLARFPKYQYIAGECFQARIELAYYRSKPLISRVLRWELSDERQVHAYGSVSISAEGAGVFHIADIEAALPEATAMTKMTLSLQIAQTDIKKGYDLWMYPRSIPAAEPAGLHTARDWSDDTEERLARGESVVLIPNLERLAHSIEGFYATDFWCYPMFRSISESMNKPVPVGTMGLLIDNKHPALRLFPSESYSTYPWWSIVSNSRSVILDDAPRGLSPIVQTIDNFERNHKLGLLWECQVLQGKLLVCAVDDERIAETAEGKQFLASIYSYAASAVFQPETVLGIEDIRKLLVQN
ncbi:sugar-binding domain-containing protein [Paenibacillus sp. NEAU-GSW1]|uniref:sugar-binding domain-containing protein n=1 Tax=Paenibacillus sp. NEAU-GSW1 TaxID=2682486 RepID=UPI0012E12C17|nr:sugar-binding domain-containing protein [Paenibacillus sp. NEAU-GSW1]MUT68241.1 beta-glucuronidase [Paenibacillus sp. NEAU-GSW1]